MTKTLYFQQITDSTDMEENLCLQALNERISKLKDLLTLEGVKIDIGEPYLIDWTEANDKYYKQLIKEYPHMGNKLSKRIGVKHIQYRANFYIKKTSRKITWNDVYKVVNSVKAVPYKFI